MTHRTITDFTQMRPGDMLEYRCPKFGLVTQWRVLGIHLGAERTESLIALAPITNAPAHGYDTVMVPEPMTRGLTIIRSEPHDTE